MIFLQRTLSVPGHGIERRYAALRRPGLRIHAVRLRGVVFDTTPLATQIRLFHQTWRVGMLQFVLRGSLVVRRQVEHTLTERRLIAEGALTWDERWEGDFDCLVVDWDEAFGPPLHGAIDGTLSAADHGRLADLHRRMLAGEAHGEAGVAIANECWQLLHSLGLPLPLWEQPALAEAPAGAQELANALSSAFSRLHQQPQWQDLEAAADVSERQLRRRLVHFAPWLELIGGSFRCRLRSLRALNAITMLGAPAMRVGEIARAVGYGSSRAMHLALAEIGLGSPSTIRTQLRSG